eukprot:TRINITY_DN1110_c0_g1_i1.p1 TRINITY_DN1110_c0_g1~~TRINITY_DN1110_c0_g1_i1.p1  ORF type:complete len:109 (+),score=34.46 TRINITY_DN1110_c0_g1_i1:120-446(+)
MDIVNSFIKARSNKNLTAVLDLMADDIAFITPKWETKGKPDLGKKLKEVWADGEPEFSKETPWEELEAGRKYTRTLKVKIVLVLKLKVRQTISINENRKIEKVEMKKL